MKKEKPFDVVARLLTEEDVKIEDEYMTNRILSFQPKTILLSIKLNKYIGRLPKWAINALFNIGIKKQRRRPYLQYLGRKKEKDKKLLSKISWAFCCNNYQARQIVNIVRQMGIKPEKYFGLKAGE